MDIKVRAEKIWRLLAEPVSGTVSEMKRNEIEYITSQLDEAVREAVLYSAPYAEGRKDGFDAAREKAAGIFEDCDTQEFGATADMKAIAERIRAMEADK